MRRSFLMGAFGVFVLAACGSDGGGGGGGSSVTAAAACKSLGAAVCARIAACSPFGLEIGYGDAAGCAARFEPRCVASLALAGTKATPTSVQTCASAYASQSCADTISGVAPVVCRTVGSLADGASCAAATQCAGGGCRIVGEGACGKCVTTIAAGQACDVSKDLCEQGYYCSASGTCDAPAQLGEGCSATHPCAADLYCNGTACIASFGAGEECPDGVGCDFYHGFLCNLLTKKCEKTGVSTATGTCGIDTTSGAITACPANAYCDYSASTCHANPVEGGACTLDAKTGTSLCASGLNCVSGKCTTGYPTCSN